MLPRFAVPVFILGFLLVAACPARAESAWLPGDAGFQPLTADPREPRFGFDLVESNRASAVAGRRFTLLRDGPSTGAATRFSVDGMLWAWLSRRPGFNFPLESVDGSFGLALDRVSGPWSGRLRYGHVSSHLGDGGYDIEARRIVYSREFVSAIASWSAAHGLRVYSGPNFMLHGSPSAPAFQAQLGGEAAAPPGGVAPFAAFDLRLKAENANRVNQSYQAGVRFGDVPGRRARIEFGYETGISERGQEWQKPEHFFHAGVVLGD
jgi:hypothetical protein